MVLASDIDKCLPQTQCGECGYPGCMPYAQALAAGAAPIDRCPPGGVETVVALGQLLHVDPTPYLADAAANTRSPAVAVIREAECIGCTKCIQACPVDAIVGSAKRMHDVVPDLCTGCGLCVAPCPVDCIDMVAIPESHYDPALARARYQAKQVRLLAEDNAKVQHYRTQRRLVAEQTDNKMEKDKKQAYILAALARVKAKF